MITVLAGGIGASRLIYGLARVYPPEDLFIIVNTGDDSFFYGLRVSPDVDTIIYTLAGLIDKKKHWGIDKDSFICLDQLSKFYGKPWFGLGDKDLATHIMRTDLLNQGYSFEEVCAKQCEALGVKQKVVPMSNEFLPTIIYSKDVQEYRLTFQEWFVKYRAKPKIERIEYQGAEFALPSSEICNALETSEKIIICPSNPFVSILPMLTIPDFYITLKEQKDKVIAVSPLISGKAVKGPLAEMLKWQEKPQKSVEIAKLYRDILGTFIIDSSDTEELPLFEKEGIQVKSTDILITKPKNKIKLANYIKDL